MSYMGKLEFAVGLFCAVLLALPALAEEDYYTWIDENGVVKMQFTMPEALTRWKFLGFIHDKDLRSGFIEFPRC